MQLQGKVCGVNFKVGMGKKLRNVLEKMANWRISCLIAIREVCNQNILVKVRLSRQEVVKKAFLLFITTKHYSAKT